MCRSGSRSTEAAKALGAAGFEAESLDGGMVGWEESGLQFPASDGAPGRVAEPEPPADDRPEAHKRLQAEFTSLIFEVTEYFGDHEPSEDEIRDYLRERMISEGSSPEEADEAMARITGGQDAHGEPG